MGERENTGAHLSFFRLKRCFQLQLSLAFNQCLVLNTCMHTQTVGKAAQEQVGRTNVRAGNVVPQLGQAAAAPAAGHRFQTSPLLPLLGIGAAIEQFPLSLTLSDELLRRLEILLPCGVLPTAASKENEAPETTLARTGQSISSGILI